MFIVCSSPPASHYAKGIEGYSLRKSLIPHRGRGGGCTRIHNRRVIRQHRNRKFSALRTKEIPPCIFCWLRRRWSPLSGPEISNLQAATVVRRMQSFRLRAGQTTAESGARLRRRTLMKSARIVSVIAAAVALFALPVAAQVGGVRVGSATQVQGQASRAGRGLGAGVGASQGLGLGADANGVGRAAGRLGSSVDATADATMDATMDAAQQADMKARSEAKAAAKAAKKDAKKAENKAEQKANMGADAGASADVKGNAQA